MDERNDNFLDEPLDLPGEPDSDDWRDPVSKRFWGKILIIIAVVTVVGAGGYFGWSAWNNSQNSKEQAAADQAAASEETEPVNDSPETTKTDNPRMELTYPSDWTLTTGEDDVRLESPKLTFTTADGNEITDGVFRLYFRQGARAADSPYIGRGIAALPSESISYTNPAPGQREDTKLSFFGLDATDNISFLFVAGNYDLAAGDRLGPDYGQEPDTYIIAGGYSSDELEEDLSMYKMPAEFFKTTEVYEQALDIIKTMQLL